MRLFQPIKDKPAKGFTIIELLVVAPIVLLTIGAFITVVVNMTGDVLAARTSTLLAYNVQNALNTINADVTLSSTFLAQTSLTQGLNTTLPLASPQGYSDDTTAFTNVDATNGTMLILNVLATSANPLNSSASYIYLTNLPNACTSNQVSQNTPMTYNIVYFVKNNTLWRRVIMPSNYQTAACTVPWQQPSCNPTYMTNNPGAPSAFCATKDQDLLDNISASNFNIQYFNAGSATIPNTVASDTGSTVAQRNAALQSLTTIGASISVSTTAAGRPITQSGAIRSTRLGTTASTIAPVSPATTPGTPVVSGSFVAAPPTATATWSTVSGGGIITYNVDYSLNGGTTWTNGFTGSTQTSYTVTSASQNKTVMFRVSASNSAGTSSYGTTSVTIPLFANMILQNGWANYNNGYSTAAFTKTSDGLVVLRGMIASGTATSGLAIATLPVGYRPASTLMFTTDTNSNVASRIDIDSSGNIQFQVGSNGWLSLDGIEFLPSTSQYTFTPMAMSNGWVNYGGSFQTAGYTIDAENRTHIQGLIASGSTTAASLIYSLPTSYLPNLYQHLNAADGNALGFIAAAQTNSTYPGAGVQYKGGGNSYLSLNNMFYTSALGASGSCPAATTGWCNLTLQNGWIWYSSTGIFATPQYTKSVDGVVTLKGLIGSGTATVGTIIAQLPVGYRPSARLLTQVVSNSATGRVDIDALGNISIQAGSNTWLSLDSINFIAEQ